MTVTKYQFARQGDVLVPVDHWSREKLHTYPEGQIVNITITTAKRIGNLNKYWAGLGTLLHNLDEDSTRQWPTTRSLHNMLLEEFGMVEKIYRIDGSFTLAPSSVAIDNLDEAAFDDFFEKAQQFMVHALGWNPWQAWADAKTAQKLDDDWKKNYRPGVD